MNFYVIIYVLYSKGVVSGHMVCVSFDAVAFFVYCEVLAQTKLVQKTNLAAARA